jgi:hypothetical protein
VTKDGAIYGTAVPNAGAVSWLLFNLAPGATTAIQQDALQAAIWRTEYGTSFQLDGVDNTNGAPSINATIGSIYRADLAALGSNTAPVSAVSWISPGANPGLPPSHGQGLVALTGLPPKPTPPNVTGIAVASRSRLGLLSFKITSSEALNPGSASNAGLYQVLAGVKKHGQMVFRKALKIRSATYDDRTDTVTIKLAKPFKGAVLVTVESGIVAANGAASSSPFSEIER